FAANCQTCHQANGLGVPSQYPPLAGSEFTTGGSRRPAMIVLKGLQGPVKVKGQQYGAAVMQPWDKTLTDQKIADVLTYERSDWGNSARPVTAGLDLEVSGVIQVVEEANGFSINASYILGENPPQSHVYWFDQSEIDAIARALVQEKRRILIVDDDRESTRLVKVLLEKAGGYLVLEENDAAKAHQSAQNFRPDVILLDIMMPMKDGGEVGAQINAEPEVQSTENSMRHGR